MQAPVLAIPAHDEQDRVGVCDCTATPAGDQASGQPDEGLMMAFELLAVAQQRCKRTEPTCYRSSERELSSMMGAQWNETKTIRRSRLTAGAFYFEGERLFPSLRKWDILPLP